MTKKKMTTACFEYWNIHRESRGFTMVEAVIMLFIVMAVSAIVLGNFSGFSGNASVRRSAQQFAFSLRRAQGQALGVREVSGGGGQVVAPAVGVYIDGTSPTSYIFFADIDGNSRYGPAEDFLIETLMLSRGVSFGAFYDENGRLLSAVNIVFRAPDGKMIISDALEPIGESALIAFQSGRTAFIRSVRVRTSGQIAVE